MSTINVSDDVIYEKPKLSQLDIDFSNLSIEEIYESKTVLPTFNYIIKKDYKGLEEGDKKYVNLTFQTGLMLAAYLGDLKAVEILLYQVGNIDSNDKTALNHAMDSKTENKEDKEKIIKLISKYEYNLKLYTNFFEYEKDKNLEFKK